MRTSYTGIKYRGKVLDGMFNVTLSSDMYADTFVGKRTVREEKIPGRDMPYFYGIEHEPLSFEVNLALTKETSVKAVQQFLDTLISSKQYEPIQFFDTDTGEESPVYFVIFKDDIVANYIRTESDRIIGYFELQARCNAPWGFEVGELTLTSNANLGLTKTGAASTNYYMEIKSNTEGEFFLRNKTAGITMTFNTKKGETIIINGYNRRFYSSTGQNEHLYRNWNGVFLELIPGDNQLEFPSGYTVTINYKTPRFT